MSPRKPTSPVAVCDKCGKAHTREHRGRIVATCIGHISGKSRPERAGQPCCQMPATGQRVCRYHGAATGQAKAAAEARAGEDAARKLASKWGTPIETTPVEAILGGISAQAGRVQFYWDRVEAVIAEDKHNLVWGRTKEKDAGDDRGNTWEAKPNIWLTLHTEAARDLFRMGIEAHKAGIEERKIQLAERDGKLVADVLRATADTVLQALLAAGMPKKLVAIYQAALAEAAPRHLRLLNGGAA